MSTDSIIETCKDYGIKPDALKTAAVSELLNSSRMKGSNSVKKIIESLEGVLDATEQMNVVRWATWVQHAQANGLEGGDIDSLLALRRTKDGS